MLAVDLPSSEVVLLALVEVKVKLQPGLKRVRSVPHDASRYRATPLQLHQGSEAARSVAAVNTARLARGSEIAGINSGRAQHVTLTLGV